jgi:DNA-binding NarL/FixJ family response regulator
MSIRVLLIQDGGFVRAGLKAVLERTGQFSVIAEAASRSEALRMCKTESPDLALIDLALPQLDGVAATAQIRREHPQIRIVILSADNSDDAVIRALASGASAVVLKTLADSDLLAVMNVMSRGGSYVSLEIYHHLLDSIQSRKDQLDHQNSKLRKLSPRELQVLQLVAAGHCSKDVAVTLGLTIETVRSYRKTMMQKLGVTNVAVLTAFAIANGAVDTEMLTRSQHPMARHTFDVA